jgi:hypothetical protein
MKVTRIALVSVISLQLFVTAHAGDLPLRPEIAPLLTAQQIQHDEIAPLHLMKRAARESLAELASRGYLCQIHVTDDSRRGFEIPSDLLCTLFDSERHPGCDALLLSVHPDWPARSKDRAQLYELLSAPVQGINAFCAPAMSRPGIPQMTGEAVDQAWGYANSFGDLHGNVDAALRKMMVDGFACSVQDSSGSFVLACQGHVEMAPDCEVIHMNLQLVGGEHSVARQSVITTPQLYKFSSFAPSCSRLVK